MSRRLIFTLAVLTALAGTPVVGAQKVEITPQIGYRFGGGLTDGYTGQYLDFNGSESYGLAFNYTLGLMGDTQLEFSWNRQETDMKRSLPNEGTFDLTIDYWQAGGLKQWQEDESVRPFVVGTVGLTHISPDESDLSSDTRFSFGLGGGVKLLPGRHVGIRLQGKFYGTYVSGGAAGICGPVGCTFGFSGNFLWQVELTAGLILAFGDG